MGTQSQIHVVFYFLSLDEWSKHFLSRLKHISGTHFLISDSWIHLNRSGEIIKQIKVPEKDTYFSSINVHSRKRDIASVLINTSIQEAVHQALLGKQLRSFSFINITEELHDRVKKAMDTRQLHAILYAIEPNITCFIS